MFSVSYGFPYPYHHFSLVDVWTPTLPDPSEFHSLLLSDTMSQFSKMLMVNGENN